MRFLLPWVFILIPQVATSETSLLHLDDPEDYVISFHPRVWVASNNQFDLEAGIGLPGGSRGIVKWDKGLENETRFTPFLEIKLGSRHKIRTELFTVDQSEEANGGDLTVTVNGVTVPTNTLPGIKVDGTIKFDVYTIGYQYDLFQMYGGYVGPLIEIAIVDYELTSTLQLDLNGDGIADQIEREEFKDIIPFPFVGMAWKLYPHPRIAVFGEVKGMSIDDYGSSIQALGGLEFQIQQHVALEVGYRYLFVEPDSKKIDFTYQSHGLFFGTVIRY